MVQLPSSDRGIADFKFANAACNGIDEPVMYHRVYNHPVGAHADLTLMEVAADHYRMRRPLDIGVGENNQRRVAAQFQRHSLDVLSAACNPANPTANRSRTGEGNHSGRRMLDEIISDPAPGTDHDIKDAMRVLPDSRTSHEVISSRRSSMIAAARYIACARSSGNRLRQPRCADLAAP